MPFVQGNCTNCGGTLAVDNEKDAWICPYCNTPFIVEKAIKNYSITNNIVANTVNIYGGGEFKEFEIVEGNLKKYNGCQPDVFIPEEVTTISYTAFHGSNVSSIRLPEGIKEVYLSSCDSLMELNLPKSVVNLGLLNCDGITSIQLHEGLQFVYFEGCSSIKSLSIPNSVKKIKKGTFRNCSSLLEINLPDSIEILDDDFMGCHNLTRIRLPQKVVNVKLSSMHRLNCIESPLYISTVVLSDLPSLEKIVVGNFKSRFIGLTGKESFCFKNIVLSSSLLFNQRIKLPVNKGSFETCLALAGRCTDCGNKATTLFGKCQFCKRKRSYKVVHDVCPKCSGNTYMPAENSKKRVCSNCGSIFFPYELKNELRFYY